MFGSSARRNRWGNAYCRLVKQRICALFQSYIFGWRSFWLDLANRSLLLCTLSRFCFLSFAKNIAFARDRSRFFVPTPPLLALLPPRAFYAVSEIVRLKSQRIDHHSPTDTRSGNLDPWVARPAGSCTIRRPSQGTEEGAAGPLCWVLTASRSRPRMLFQRRKGIDYCSVG